MHGMLIPTIGKRPASGNMKVIVNNCCFGVPLFKIPRSCALGRWWFFLSWKHYT